MSNETKEKVQKETEEYKEIKCCECSISNKLKMNFSINKGVANSLGKIKKLDLYLKSLTRKYFPWIRDLDVKMKPNMYQKKTIKFLYNLVYDLKSRSNQRKVINLTRKT